MAQKPIKRLIRVKKKPPLWQRMRANFLTGLVVVVPLALTVWMVWAFVNFIDAKVLPLIPAAYNPSTYLERDIFGYGLVVFLIFTTFVGALTKGYIGTVILARGEKLLHKTPVISSLYGGLKQIIETVLSQSQSSFKQTCLIEYPRKDVWAVGFISTEAKGEISNKLPEESVAVFLPTTPNPTSGFLLFVPKKDLILLDMDVETAAKLIISAGLVNPADLPITDTERLPG